MSKFGGIMWNFGGKRQILVKKCQNLGRNVGILGLSAAKFFWGENMGISMEMVAIFVEMVAIFVASAARFCWELGWVGEMGEFW